MKPLRLSESEEAALNAVCPNLLNSKEARSNHPADRHRFRAKCLAESRRLLEASKGEGRAATRAELEAFDSITRLVDLVDLQNEADRHAQAEFNQEHGGDGRVFSNSAKVARTAPTGELAGLQVGDLMRAMVTGATSGEIRNVLAEGTDSAGGYTVPTVLVEQFIDRMRAASVCVTAGAKTVLLDTKQTSIARLETDPAPAWRAENG